MTQTRSRLHGLIALALMLALVVVAGIPAATFAQDKAKNDKKAKATEVAAEPTPEPTPKPTPEPTPEPTPYPEFDPSSVTLRLDLYATDFEAPVFIADDGVNGKRCRYVVERGGLVKIIEADESTRPRPFLDLTGRLGNIGPEQGLHSIAFHPDFAKNGRFFVHYTTSKKESIVAEFKGNACGVARNKPVKTILFEKQEYINDNGGWMDFGPDGKLYVATGDGGGPAPGDPKGLGQTPSTRLGKILRIDVDRRDGIARDNPYVKVAKNGKLRPRGGFARETWAYGLRDPRRASFDRATGDLWIGDVGQDRFEEINRIPAGETRKNRGFNFGWSDVVGADTCHNLPDCDPTQYDPPVYYYDKVSPHRGVTGGYVYRGELLPDLSGVYLFGDVASGYIWGLDADAVREGFEVPAHQLLDAPRGIVSFGEDDEGELYVVSLEGSIYRVDLFGS
jgi:glucose/arabinose dehydrogenase